MTLRYRRNGATVTDPERQAEIRRQADLVLERRIQAALDDDTWAQEAARLAARAYALADGRPTPPIEAIQAGATLITWGGPSVFGAAYDSRTCRPPQGA